MAQSSILGAPIIDATLAVFNSAEATNTTPESHSQLQDSAAKQGVPAALLEQETPKNLHATNGAYDFKRAALDSPAMLKIYQDINSAKVAQDDLGVMSQLSNITRTSLSPTMRAIGGFFALAPGTESGYMQGITGNRAASLESIAAEQDALEKVKSGELDFESFSARFAPQEQTGSTTALIAAAPGEINTAAAPRTVEEWQADINARAASLGGKFKNAASYSPFFKAPASLETFQKSKGIEETLGNITPEVIGYSVGQGATQDPAATALAALLAPFTGPAPLIARIGIGAVSNYKLNYNLNLADELLKSGVDVTDPQALRQFFAADRTKTQLAGGAAKGGADAAINALASVAASRMRVGGALTVGGLSGMAGEAGGNLAAQQTGAKGFENTAVNIVSEGLADSVFTALEVYNAAVTNSDKPTIDAKAYVALLSRTQKLMDKAARSSAFSAALDEFTSAFSSMKVLKTDPTVAQKFAEELNAEGAPKDLFLDPQALQQANVDIQELAKLSPTFAARVGEAVATGGTVQVPFSEYVTLVAPTMGNKLNDHVRAEPDGFSRAEAEEFMQTQSELVKTEAANIAAEAKLSEPFEASSAAVEENIFGQLKTTGRFTDTVNRFYAKLTASAFTVNGAKLGLTAEQFYNEFGGINIVGDTDASPAVFTQTYKGMQLEQDGRLKVTHFSATKGITQLDPNQWGLTGAALPRSERNRQGLVPNRVYGYLGTDFKKENQLGDVRYTGYIDPSRYYDLESDPLSLRQRGAAISNERGFNDVTAGIELAVQEAGFDGYIAKAPQGGLAVVSYKPIDVTEGDVNDSGQTTTEGLQDGSGVRGSGELLDATRRANLEPLEGAHGPVEVAGRGKVQFGPFAPARAAAEAYMASTGRVYQPPKKHVKIDTERAKRIAQEFELMKHDPLDPVVEAAYRAMIDETLAQYQFVKQTGLKVEFLQLGQEDPYAASPRLATLDVIENNHLWVFPTDFGFGGPASTNVDIADNPLLQPTQEFVDGKQLLANDVFRIVHDYFGHIKDGQGFRAEGEENAWQSHAAMFSPLARRALTTETRGQNSWVNFGPHAEKNKTASGADTEYAPQKIGLLPEWVSQEGFEGGVDSGKVGAYNQLAFHGSPFTFDKFVLDHLGSGQGEQAYGWGLYFASNQEVANFYREKLSVSKILDKIRGTYSENTPVAEAFEQAIASEKLNPKEKQFLKALQQEEFLADVQPHEGLFYIRGQTDRGLSDHIKKALKKVGDIYSADIPEDSEMLTWELPVKDQPKIVRDVLESVAGDDVIDTWKTNGAWEKVGAGILHGQLVKMAARNAGEVGQLRYKEGISPQQAVSKWLNSKGVKGVKYLDVGSRTANEIGRSHNYVVFDAESIRMIETFSQEAKAQQPRGTFNPKTNTIALLKAANLSTFIHESGHLFLEMLAFSAAHPNAQADIKADMDAALKWMGVSDITGNRMEVWNTLTLEQKRPFHEKWARGFEAYLFEGKSPAAGLADVFRRMKAWLIRTYKDIANLDVELDPEIRGVFDRMVATSDQIKEAQNMRAYEALFDDRAESGMADAEFRVYEALQTTSTQEALEELQRRSLRDMQWMTNAKSREMKKLQKRNVAKRREVREEVRAELMTQPAYQAIKFFKTGQYEAPIGASKEVRDAYLETSVQNHKLSLPVLKETYGEEGNALWRFLQGGKYGFVAQEGMHPDAAATMFGYDSGDAMIRDILATPDFNDTVEGMTDQRMLEQYGDLIDERAMERAAEKAIHNEARSKVIATEMNALQKAAGRTRIMASMAKAYADDAIGKLLVREVRPGQYTRQEAKAARESAEAFRKGDIETAAIKKRAQLLQNYSAKAAFDALDDVEKAIRYFKKFDKASIAKKISPEYVDQIHQLLDRYELTTTTLKALDKRKSLRDFVERQQELGIEPNIPPEVMDEVSRKNYREATVDELRGLYDTIKQIEHLGRLKNKLLTAKDQRDFDATVDKIVANIRAKGPKRILDNTTRASNWEATKINFKGYLAMHRKVGSIGRQLDGFEDGGIFWDTFIRTMNDAGATEAKMREETTEKMLAIIQPLLSSRPFADAFGSKKEFYPSVGRSLNREERMAIALNVGNAGNLQRLLDGEGWEAQQITPILDSLSKEEWDAIQSIWDLFESFRPQIAAKEKRVYGVEPKWVDPTPVMTPHGEYRGGYYPIKYDGRRNDKAAAFNEAEEAKAMLKGAFLSATTRRSFTKARSDEVKGRPLLYTMDGMYSGLNDVIHDLTWHEWVIDMNRMMRDGRVSSAVRDIYGDPILKQIKSAVRDIAGGDAMPADPFERVLADLRAGATVAGLGFNLVNSLINVTGMTQSVSRIGARWMLVGLREMSTRPRDLVQEVHERSDMMRTRMRTRGREINEIQSRIRGKSTVREKVDNLMFAPMYLTQMMVDTPTWWGAYQKNLLEFGDDSKAAALADQAVLDAQSGGQIKDLAAIQRGNAYLKLFTTFYGYFSGTYNLAVEKTKKTNFSDPADVVRLGGDYLLLAVVPAVLTTVIKTAMQGDDEEWELDKFAKKAAAESAGFALATMVGVREFGGIVQMLAGTNYGTSGYGGPAGLRFFSEIYKLANQASQGEADSALMKAFVNVIGVIFKLPSAQINRTLTGTDALIQGETDNPFAIIGGPPPK